MPEEYFTARDGGSSVIGDIRHFPVLIVTWFGEPTEPLVRAYFAWSDEVAREAHANGQRYAIISDNSHALRPSPTVRKLIATLIDEGPAAKTDRVVASFAVFESALVRGAVTAMQWLSRQSWNLHTTATVQHAVEGALDALAEQGIQRPAHLSPATYVTPEAPTGPELAHARR